VGNSLGALRSASTPNEAAAALLAIRGTEEIEKLAAHTGGGSAPAAESTSTTVFDAGFVAGVLERAAGEVEAFHEANPLRDGVPKARLAEHIGVQLDDLDTILARSEEIEVVGASVRRVGFGVDLSEGDQTIWDGVAADLAAAGFGPPRRAELGLPIELEHALTRRGDLVEVSSDLLYRADTLQKIVEATGQISSPFTVADFRDALEITRKHAIPLLEWMDRTGVTVRDGDVRRLAG
jgi:selenocysteine-specific elongation factor